MPAATVARRRSRFWLYAPYVLLALLAAGWSGVWIFARAKVDAGLDAGIAREARAGRSWTCQDRSIGGFPFRIELRCAGLTLVSTRWGDEVKISTGPALAVGQVASPGHIILQMTGPLVATLPEGRRAEAGWKLFEASLRLSGLAFERFSLALAEPAVKVFVPGQAAAETWRADTLEAHLRPDPQRFASEETVELALTAKGGVLPALDALLGGAETADLELQASLSRSLQFRRGFNPDALEGWRRAGGALGITRLALNKGPARLEATGRIGLDEGHRPSGQADAAVAGIERVAGIRVGGLTAGLGSLLGRRPAAPENNAAAGLTPLPPLVLREGRVYLGPLRLPLQPLAPLY